MSVPSILTASALLAAAAAIAGYASRVFKWLDRQEKQDEDIKHIKAEQVLLVRGVLACLKGLGEQGCDGPVTDAIREIEAHLNAASHR